MRKQLQAGRRTGTYSQATRVLRLLEFLRRHVGLTLGDLATKFEVTDRQIRRDIEALEDAGYGVDWTIDDDRRTRVRMASVQPGTIHLGIRERYTLLAIRRMFDVLRDTAFAADVEAIFDKVAAALPDDERRHLDEMDGRFFYLPDGGTKAYRGKARILDEILTGIIRRRHVKFRYQNASGDVSTGMMEPYSMVLYKHGLYVIGQVPEKPGSAGKHARPHLYAVERFSRAKFLKGEAFEIRKGFSVEDYFEGAFGVFPSRGKRKQVVVDFTREAKPYVEARIWHRSQKLKGLRGGGVRLTFNVAGLSEVASWIRSWGAMARVRAPKELLEPAR